MTANLMCFAPGGIKEIAFAQPLYVVFQLVSLNPLLTAKENSTTDRLLKSLLSRRCFALSCTLDPFFAFNL